MTRLDLVRVASVFRIRLNDLVKVVSDCLTTRPDLVLTSVWKGVFVSNHIDGPREKYLIKSCPWHLCHVTESACPLRGKGERIRIERTGRLGSLELGIIIAVPVLHIAVLVLVGTRSCTLEHGPRVTDEKVVAHLGRARHDVAGGAFDTVGVEGGTTRRRLRVDLGVAGPGVAGGSNLIEAVGPVHLVELVLVLWGEAD